MDYDSFGGVVHDSSGLQRRPDTIPADSEGRGFPHVRRCFPRAGGVNESLAARLG